MSENAGEIGVKITAKDTASKPLKLVQSDIKGVKGALAGLLSIIPGFNTLSRITGWLYKTHMTVGLKAYAKALWVATLNTIKLGIATLVAMWPIILIIGAIVAAIILAIVIYQHWAEIAEFLKKAWDAFIQWLHAAWQWLLDAGTKFWQQFGGFITALWNGILALGTFIWTTLTTVVTTAWTVIGGFIMEKIGWILTIIKTAWGLIKAISEGDWSKVKDIITKFVIAMYTVVLSYVHKIIDALASIPIIGPYIAGGVKWLAGIAGIPGFQFGTRYVLGDTLAYLHKGEMVVPSHNVSTSRVYSPTINNYITTGPVSSAIDIDDMTRQITDRMERDLGRVMR